MVHHAHVLLIGDPQVQHPALTPKGSWWANPVRRILFELNLRKSWHVTARLRPDAVIFLGDMLANGKSAEIFEQYELASHKFKNIFPVDEGVEVYYVPGNNDVGLGPASADAKPLRSFYVKSFGPLNQHFVIQNHTFVALDAPGLVEEDYMRHSTGMTYDDWKPVPDGPVDFVKEMADYGPAHVILLSHIPLSRSETANCGPLREKGGIRRGAGPGYQTLLGKQTTHFLLNSLEPSVVFR
ncbi:hypothetical protein NLJ89_g10214 [Agrocybe chaxingu]|uniref:Calcineurin-like phosphoesterase domain-containing protein n=1 Tax=Agrocybe chaxingu TaxID=84603 RepID=A0A9W8JR03_9AGAR|nr:hypothetical protein NLJ89_g10214 [Agrocybe chaxingu]